MKKAIIWIIVLVVVAGGGFWLFRNQTSAPQESSLMPVPNEEGNNVEETVVNNESTTTQQQNQQGNGEPQPNPTPQPVVRPFTVTGDTSFRFNPNEIRVKQGETVQITFKNAGGMHDWRLDEFSAKTKILQAGEEETISFVASRKGSFEYYCSVGNHRQMGMVGTLIVE